MNILLTNDDGYQAYGINLLAKLLSKHGNVFVVAPCEVMSAKSVSIILSHPITVEKKSEHLYVASGTPADCVAFGLSSLGIKFDLVVSGINHGHNISYDTMYSGTIGACLQALTYQVPAIAFSCENNFEIVEKYFNQVFEVALKEKSSEYMLNINFPFGEDVEDIRFTHIYYRKETTFYKNVKGFEYQALRELHDENCVDENSDVYAVHHHLVSISKLAKTLDYE